MVVVAVAESDGSRARHGAGRKVLDDVSEFDLFYERSYRRVLAIAVAATGNWADAEELVQDAYAAAHRRWSTIAHYDDPAAFVCRVVLNRSASRWRRKARELKAVARLSHRQAETSTIDDWHDGEFWRAVAELPAQQSRAIALYYVADLSVAAVAAHLGCSEGATKSHLSRARTTLRETLRMPEPTEGGDHG